MSKQWKIVIGIVVVVVVLGAILIGMAGFVVSRSRDFRVMARPPQSVAQLEVRLLDDDEDGIPDRGVAALPGLATFGRDSRFERGGRFDQGFPGKGAQLDVQLLDDDGDGIPDRGVLDLPARGSFGPDFGPGRNFGRGFAPGWDHGRFTSRGFTPFLILGGLFRLAVLAAVLAGLVGLGVVLYRRWGPSPSAPAAPVSPAPPETEPEATEPPPTEPEEPSVSPTGVESELDTAESEATEPEDEQLEK